jgi:CO/xanthine dehydrogenase Mo-binding subunit
VTIFSGKVDLGQGLRIAIPQMAAEELGIGVDRIAMVEGDTASLPTRDRRPAAAASCAAASRSGRPRRLHARR